MINIAPVRKQVTVAASQQRAFALFTNEMSRWWPATHSILKSPLKQYVVEPRVGGRWYAVAEDGSTGQTGYVIEWQPPQRLVDGSMTWALKAGATGTDITVSYAVGGYAKDGFDGASKGTDHVLGEQIERLRKFIET